MSTNSSESTDNNTEHQDKRKGNPFLPFEMLRVSEVMWAPYRSLTTTLMHAHRNTAALIQINRKLADEFRDITRRQQDFLLDFSEKMLSQVSEGTGASKRVGALPIESMDQYFESAIAGVREFGTAIADAQVHSIEALREHAHEVAKTSPNSVGTAHAAE